ncbi:hypothetical protein DAETH_05450 [Deinococcus aetherius]|uniref:Uncharacterized protein n=1 Tax=Deinococcus aetherius TaxID=200252 RepID=A0ABM8AA67_9DEIO|nr:hypothetical protein DAETH_05450 [Deinococcus aetherius]
MPEAVQDRVHTETLAHLEDAGVGEGADVRAVLGNPKAMRRELGRLYVPVKRLRGLIEGTSFGSTYVVPMLFLGLAFSDIRSDPRSPYDDLLGQAVLIVLGLWIFTLLLTQRLSLVRRRFWGSAVGFTTWWISSWLSNLSDFLNGTSDDLWNAVFLTLWPFFIGYYLWSTWHEDRRLRHTLALVGGAQL